MTHAVAHILEEVKRLSAAERADLTDRMVEGLARDVSPDIEETQIEEVRRRVSQIEDGDVPLIPGEVALARVREIIAMARATD